MTKSRFFVRTLVPVSGLAAVCLALGACGSSDDESSGSGGSAVVIKTPASGCGSLPLPAVKDPDGVVSALPESTSKQFKGYTGTVHKSPWANWKPKGSGPYKVGVTWSALVSDFQTKNLDSLKKGLAADPNIKTVLLPPPTDFNITTQLQQMDSLINQGVDLIVVQALAPDALVPAAKRAGAAGIPMIEVQGTVPEPHVVNIQSNNYQSAGYNAAGAMQILGGKGNIVLAHGIQGLFTDIESFKGFNAAIKLCPDAKVGGEITGLFQNATVKGETLKYLATHPEKVDAALQVGAMSTGIMQGFDQAGRPMPIVNTIGTTRGSLGYWLNNKDKYQAIGSGLGPAWLGDAAANVVRRMLAGQGVKSTDIINTLPAITNQNVDQWADPAWTLQTPGEGDKGPRGTFLTNASLNPFFNNPEDIK